MENAKAYVAVTEAAKKKALTHGKMISLLTKLTEQGAFVAEFEALPDINCAVTRQTVKIVSTQGIVEIPRRNIQTFVNELLDIASIAEGVAS